MQPSPVFLPGESQGQGSLPGCRLWGHTESDTTKRLSSSSLTPPPTFYGIITLLHWEEEKCREDKILLSPNIIHCINY